MSAVGSRVDTIGGGRARLLGPESRPQPRTSSRTARASRRSATLRPERCSTRSHAAIRRFAGRRSRPTCSPTRRRRRGRDRDACLDPLPARAARARGRQARLRREAAGRVHPTAGGRSSAELAEERGLVLMPGHTFLYSPPVTRDPRADRRGRARRHLLHLDEPRESRAPPARRERRLGPRAARLLDPSLLARRDARRRRGAEPRAASSPARPTSRSSTSSSVRDAIAHVELSWLAPSKLRRTTIVGSRKMVVYDDTSNEPVRVFDSGAMLRDPADLRRVPAHLPHRRRSSLPTSRHRNRCASSSRTSATPSGQAGPLTPPPSSVSRS